MNRCSHPDFTDSELNVPESYKAGTPTLNVENDCTQSSYVNTALTTTISVSDEPIVDVRCSPSDNTHSNKRSQHLSTSL